MAHKFGSPEWLSAYQQVINASPTYREAAKHWEGDFWFIIEPSETTPERVFMYLDLWHGECREAFVTADDSVKTPEFRIWGTSEQWGKVLSRQIDPIRALMTNTIKVKGNMAKITRNVKAAQELVLCATQVETEY